MVSPLLIEVIIYAAGFWGVVGPPLAGALMWRRCGGRWPGILIISGVWVSILGALARAYGWANVGLFAFAAGMLFAVATLMAFPLNLSIAGASPDAANDRDRESEGGA